MAFSPRSFDRENSEIEFNGEGGWMELERIHANRYWRLVMSNTPVKIAVALLLLLSAPAASFARMAGEAGAGNVPISCIPPGPGNAGGMSNVTVDPSGIGNASRMAPLPPPRISVPAIPQFK
jgi:hypothetical protein